jgi:hypothetical protein
VVEHDHEHGCAAKEDGQAVEGGVCDHFVFFVEAMELGGCAVGWID